MDHTCSTGPSLSSIDHSAPQALPRTHSTVSPLSPGTTTPGSWKADSWARSSPETTPPSSETGSPELKPRSQDSIGDISRVERQNMGEVKNICFIGAGFVGGPTAAVIAYHNPEILVNVVDLNDERIVAWNSQCLPIREYGLLKVVRVARDGTRDCSISLPGHSCPIQLRGRSPNLFFSTRVVEAVSNADIIFICVNTPTKTQGIGAGSMADISAVESATRTVAMHARSGAIIVEKSTVPCGTARMIQDILRFHRQRANFEVLSNPEFLAEGTAIENLMHPDRILVGSAQTLSGLRAASRLKNVYASWVPPAKIVTINTFSSEMAKLVANAMLAQRISSINAVSAICDELGLGADVDDVSLALGKDRRLGPHFLQAGVGFGGSCFEKDILNLSYLANQLHLDVVADYWLGVLRINEHQRQRFARKIVHELNGSLRGKKIAVLGFAFKDGTNDTRNSIAVHVIRDIAEEVPREIAIFDPGCSSVDIMEEIQRMGLGQGQLGRVNIASSWRDAVRGATAVCVLTPWKQFRGRRLGNTVNKELNGSLNARLPFGSGKSQRVLSEMDIMALEAFVGQAHGTMASEDPLGRLRPLPACAARVCTGCKERGTEVCEAYDMVDWAEVAGMMQEPRWVFDGRNIVDLLELQGLGFRVRGIGKGAWMT